MFHDRLPLSPDVTMSDFDDGEHDVYTFDTPGLKDLYIVRHMNFGTRKANGDMSSFVNNTDLTLGEQYRIYATELEQLRQSGVAIPQVFVGLPENYETAYSRNQDLLVVAHRIEAVEISDENRELAAQQARMALSGLAKYIETSFSDKRDVVRNPLLLSDIFTPEQWMYGSPVGQPEKPDFYMVDVGADFRYVTHAGVREDLACELELDMPRYFQDVIAGNFPLDD